MSEVLRYRSMAEATGYGLSAIGYIEALLERGIEVDWAPLIWDPSRGRYVMTTIRHRSVPELLTPRTRRRLCRARDTEPGTVIAHTIPEYWPELLAAPGPSVGYTMWETDALPGHWPALLELPDRLLVPSRFSASVIEAAGCTTPVVVVPLLPSPAFDLEASVSAERLHRWRSRYGIAADEWVFYTVNEWHPRKALPLLLHAYLLAFTAADPVTLVIKTSARWRWTRRRSWPIFAPIIRTRPRCASRPAFCHRRKSRNCTACSTAMSRLPAAKAGACPHSTPCVPERR